MKSILFKKYIQVVTVCDEYGELTPLFILWNGLKFKVDKVIEKRQSSSKVGGCGTLYICKIEGKERRLFYEINRWFIESQIP